MNKLQLIKNKFKGYISYCEDSREKSFKQNGQVFLAVKCATPVINKATHSLVTCWRPTQSKDREEFLCVLGAGPAAAGTEPPHRRTG